MVLDGAIGRAVRAERAGQPAGPGPLAPTPRPEAAAGADQDASPARAARCGRSPAPGRCRSRPCRCRRRPPRRRRSSASPSRRSGEPGGPAAPRSAPGGRCRAPTRTSGECPARAPSARRRRCASAVCTLTAGETWSITTATRSASNTRAQPSSSCRTRITLGAMLSWTITRSTATVCTSPACTGRPAACERICSARSGHRSFLS